MTEIRIAAVACATNRATTRLAERRAPWTLRARVRFAKMLIAAAVVVAVLLMQMAMVAVVVMEVVVLQLVVPWGLRWWAIRDGRCV